LHYHLRAAAFDKHNWNPVMIRQLNNVAAQALRQEGTIEDHCQTVCKAFLRSIHQF